MIVGLHWGTRGAEEKIETAHSSGLRAFGGSAATHPYYQTCRPG